MKYLEFFKVDKDGHEYLLREMDEVYSFWENEEEQKKALHRGATYIINEDEMIEKIDGFQLSLRAKEYLKQREISID